jgi:hypothetical protein
VLGLRLKLSIADLGAVERWAERAIPDADNFAGLADLQSAGEAGEVATIAQLARVGGEPTALDVMRALGPVRVEKLDAGELRQLAERLDLVLKPIAAAGGLPDLLKPALEFIRDFQAAGAEDLARVEAEVRELLHEVKEYAAELPDEPDDDAPNPPENAKVSAIVVSYRTGDVLFDCLAALLADPGIAEIVLVDNGNPIETLERIEDAYGKSPKLTVVGEGKNRGFAAGVNLGARVASGNRLLVINPDAVLQPGSVAAFESARADQAEPVIVGGKIYGVDGVEQRGGRRRRLTMPSAAVTFLGMNWLKPFSPDFVNINLNTTPEPEGPVPMEAVSGALMYVSRAGFDRLGGFDDGYFMHVEDLDLCRRAEADGGAVIYTPLAKAMHHGATSEAPKAAVERYKAAGLTRYFKKFAETPAERTAATLLGPMISIALVMRARLRGR